MMTHLSRPNSELYQITNETWLGTGIVNIWQ